MSSTIPSSFHMGVGGSRKNKTKGGIVLAHCFVLSHLYLNGLFTHKEEDIKNRTEVSEEEDGSM